jgi:ElaA protein
MGGHRTGEDGDVSLCRASFAELDAPTLYALLRLRTDVFVVEQTCPYPELDGRDVEEDAGHWWFADDSGPTAYLRTVAEPDGATRIGRVVTRADCRSQGLARRLVEEVLADGPGPWVADAQSHLVAWYEALGVEVTGPEYLEDDIPHVPLRRGVTG